MLLGSFYNIISSEKKNETHHVQVEFNPAHEIFNGHFPGMPVVPGVCQTQMLLETLNELLGTTLEIKRAQHIKFLALLNPAKHNPLSLEINVATGDGENFFVNALYSNNEETFFRFKGELR